MPTTITGTSYAYHGQITSAGSSAFTNIGHGMDYLAGYTGSGATRSVNIRNQVAGTGTNLSTNETNAGVVSSSEATTTGTNVGIYSNAQGGDVSIGNYTQAIAAKNNAINVGVHGQAVNTGTTSIQVGGIFTLGSSAVTYESGALIADNGATTSPIFLLRDNGTKVVSVVDGGNVGIGVTAPTEYLHIAASTTAKASLALKAGAKPTTPIEGAIWNNSTTKSLEANVNGINLTIGSVVGQTTLVAGTKTITITGLTTGGKVVLTRNSQGGAVATTVQYEGTCTTNTLTITAEVAAGTINVSDTSVLTYVVYP